ncbi:MAG: hypothetical protein RL531_1675 [Actinomycetota bacterium]
MRLRSRSVPDYVDETSTELERKAKALEVVALAETITYCILFYFWIIQPSAPGTAITGFFHGLIWLAFVAMTLMITPGIGWSWGFAAVAVLTGPIGGILVWWRITRGGVPYRTGGGTA